MKSSGTLNEISEETGIPVGDLQKIIDDYHESLDRRMEFDRALRKDVFTLFDEIQDGLSSLPIPLKLPPRSGRKFATVLVNGKPIGDVKPLGPISYVKQEEDDGNSNQETQKMVSADDFIIVLDLLDDEMRLVEWLNKLPKADRDLIYEQHVVRDFDLLPIWK